MVNGSLLRLVVSSLQGVLEGADVPDVGDCMNVSKGLRAEGLGWITWEPIRRGSTAIILIILIVHDEELLVFGVKKPSLVSVLGTFIRRAGDDAGVGLVGHIVNGKTVLVVSITDIMAKVFLVWTFVLKALSIVDVTILRRTARASRL